MAGRLPPTATVFHSSYREHGPGRIPNLGFKAESLAGPRCSVIQRDNRTPDFKTEGRRSPAVGRRLGLAVGWAIRIVVEGSDGLRRSPS